MKLTPEQRDLAKDGPIPLLLDKINELEEQIAALESKEDKSLDITVNFV